MINNYSISTLFSSLNSGNSGNSSNNFSSGIYNNLSEFSSIRSGNYRLLVKKYYSINSSDDKKGTNKNDKVNQTISTSKDKTALLASIKSSSSQLKDSANDIRKGRNSLFSSKDGSYDSAKAYDAVKGFVSDYNSVIENTSKSNSSSITSAAKSMVGNTLANSNMLSKVGITIDEDSKLSINEDKFKSASVNDVKTLFSGNGSYAYQTSVKAAMVENAANNESAKSNTYNGYGGYTNNFSTGDLFSSII